MADSTEKMAAAVVPSSLAEISKHIVDSMNVVHQLTPDEEEESPTESSSEVKHLELHKYLVEMIDKDINSVSNVTSFVEAIEKDDAASVEDKISLMVKFQEFCLALKAGAFQKQHKLSKEDTEETAEQKTKELQLECEKKVNAYEKISHKAEKLLLEYEYEHAKKENFKGTFEEYVKEMERRNSKE